MHECPAVCRSVRWFFTSSVVFQSSEIRPRENMNQSGMLSALIASIVLVLTQPGQAQDQGGNPVCKQGGFFRVPEDCTRFYRCVDLTGLGYYTAYFFNCPAGTVFDERIGVCNFPWAAPPCDSNGEQGQQGQQQPGDGEDNNVVVVAPDFGFTCTAPGFFPHASDCQRFWLCKGGGDFNALSPELYKCPEGFLFNDSMRRCLRADQVECNKVPDLARIALEPVPIQLSRDELSGFFARYRYFKK